MVITLQNLKPTYMSDDEIASSDIYKQENIYFEKGKKYLIQAHSGRGKTSLLNFIYGSNISYNGEILYNDHKLKHEEVFALRKANLSYVFQDFKLFPELTLLENIQIKNKLTKHKTTQEIDFWIDKVMLNHKRNSLVKNLSLGQRQRVAILRALCQPFDFLLLDEPFSHLDKENVSILIEIITAELIQQQAGLLMTTLDGVNFFEFDKVLKL